MNLKTLEKDSIKARKQLANSHKRTLKLTGDREDAGKMRFDFEAPSLRRKKEKQ